MQPSTCCWGGCSRSFMTHWHFCEGQIEHSHDQEQIQCLFVPKELISSMEAHNDYIELLTTLPDPGSSKYPSLKCHSDVPPKFTSAKAITGMWNITKFLRGLHMLSMPLDGSPSCKTRTTLHLWGMSFADEHMTHGRSADCPLSAMRRANVSTINNCPLSDR